MKLTRPVLALALGAALVISGAAEAKIAPKPVCNVVTDPSGDASLQSPLPSSAALDIVSADLATDKKNITAAIRVKKLSATDPTTGPTGLGWTFNFTSEEIVFSLHATSDATGKVKYTASSKAPSDKIGKLVVDGSFGTFDLAKNEIRITTPADIFASELTLKAGKTTLTALGATASVSIAVSVPAVASFSDSEPVDEATTTKSYKAGTLSCVKPGK